MWRLRQILRSPAVLSMYYDWLTAQRVTLRQMAEKAQKLLLGAVGGLLGKRRKKRSKPYGRAV